MLVLFSKQISGQSRRMTAAKEEIPPSVAPAGASLVMQEGAITAVSECHPRTWWGPSS